MNLITALGFYSTTSSIESLERLDPAQVFNFSTGGLQREQKIGGWQKALEIGMNLKDSKAYHKLVGSKYLVGSSSAAYCKSKYPTHMIVLDARIHQVLVDHFLSVPKCVRLATMSERSYELLTKIILAVPKRSEGELQDVVGENFMKLSEFEKKKESGALPTEFPTLDETTECTKS